MGTKKHTGKTVRKIKRTLKVNVESLESNPHCNHGPTLMFTIRNGPKFYACSAYRRRKDCSFYQNVVGPPCKPRAQETLVPPVTFKKLRQELQEEQVLNPNFVNYCHTCARFIKKTDMKNHCDHNVQGNITTQQTLMPTQVSCCEGSMQVSMCHFLQLLQPLQVDSKEAQYFFSDASLTYLEQCVQDLSATFVICLGTPSLAQRLNNNPKYDIFLLDLDYRFGMFFENFGWYNMFNHHFLTSTSEPVGHKEDFLDKLKDARVGGNFVIVLDPPFGGRVEPLAQTLKGIAKDIRQLARLENIFILWAFPYFQESHIQAHLPNMQMLDYKVHYANHKKLCSGKTRRSPVRIFTNAPLEMFSQPAEEGYKLCKHCCHMVAIENKHCIKCNACTSKNGMPYAHCDICGTCVKASWEHCRACKRCSLRQHSCCKNQTLLN